VKWKSNQNVNVFGNGDNAIVRKGKAAGVVVSKRGVWNEKKWAARFAWMLMHPITILFIAKTENSSIHEHKT